MKYMRGKISHAKRGKFAHSMWEFPWEFPTGNGEVGESQPLPRPIGQRRDFMFYVNEKSWAAQLFKNTPYHLEKKMTTGQEKALALTGTDLTSGENDQTLSEISAKLQNGLELSPSELDYLRQNAPDLYKEAVRMIALRKEIEERLERCKSKEEVARAQSEISSRIAVECDVAPSKKIDLKKAKMYERRINLAKNCYKSFAKSDSFKNLPGTDAEYVRLKAEKMKEHFVDLLEISKKGKAENSRLSEKTDSEEAADQRVNEQNSNALTDAENEKKLDAADKKDKKSKSTKEIPLFTKDYKQVPEAPSAMGFSARA